MGKKQYRAKKGRLRAPHILAILLILSLSASVRVWQQVIAEDRVTLPILMYHHVLKDAKRWGPYVVSPDLLEQDLRYLQEHGYQTIVVQDLIDYVYHNRPLPEKPIMITFDDGHYSNMVYAFPLLQQYQSRAVLSIVGKYTDLFTQQEDPNPNYAYLSWPQAGELLQSGVFELQHHSYDLHTINARQEGSKRRKGEGVTEYQRRFLEDTKKLQDRFLEQLDYQPTAYTYPFGSISKESYDVIRELGFYATFSCTDGTNIITHDPDSLYLLKRYLRPAGKSSDRFFQSLSIE